MTHRSALRAPFGLLIGAVVTLGLAACQPPGASYTVNSVGDGADIRADGICATSNGACTLRAALTEDQRDGRASTIHFAIAGAGPHTIRIATPLPTLGAGRTTIDGYRQAGARRNTDRLVSNAALRIQVQGTEPGRTDALVVTSSANVIRGIALFDLRLPIRITGSAGTANVVTGNFVGTNAAGTFNSTRFTSNAFGVVVSASASRNRIGGSSPADRNVISGNAGRGVLICSPPQCVGGKGANDNVVQGNLVGLTPGGSGRRPNLGHGIDVNQGSSRNRIDGNVVSGNNGHGIEISHGTNTVGNLILGNRIGTGASGLTGPAYARNLQPNVRIEDGPRDTVVAGNVIGNSAVGGIVLTNGAGGVTGTRIERNRIGVSANGALIPNGPYGIRLERAGSSNGGPTGNVIGPSNMIVGNGTGIQVVDPGTVRNRITRNAIRANTGLGIDLTPPAGVSPNDTGDADAGPNDLLNWPVLQRATATSVTGTACAGCRVEVFVADGATSAYGEGSAFLGEAVAGSRGTFTVTIARSGSARVVTATATDGVGNTSEFSRNLAVPAG